MKTRQLTLTAPVIRAKKGQEKIAMLTAYDHTMATLLDPYVDILLVGDTLGCVVQGGENTLSVTLEQIVYHATQVARAAQHALVVGDLPFGSYQLGPQQGLNSAITLVKQAGVGAVKLEGGLRSCATIEKIVDAGIPVMAHIGLTPQSIHAFGGNKVQGKQSQQAKTLLEDAKAVADAGAFALIIEAVPETLAAEITAAIDIPTIGIGAGRYCDGQVLVINDMIGLNAKTAPMKFNKEYCQVRELISKAVESFAADVRQSRFPDEQHSYGLPKVS